MSVFVDGLDGRFLGRLASLWIAVDGLCDRITTWVRDWRVDGSIYSFCDWLVGRLFGRLIAWLVGRLIEFTID